MAAALRSDLPPALPAQVRPKVLPLRPAALRDGEMPRSLGVRSPLRFDARRRGAEALEAACVQHGVGNATLAAHLGLRGDKAGAEARSGELPVTAGELVGLAPLHVMLDTVIELLLHRLARERVTVGDTAELRLAAIHVEALRALLIR